MREKFRLLLGISLSTIYSAATAKNETKSRIGEEEQKKGKQKFSRFLIANVSLRTHTHSRLSQNGYGQLLQLLRQLLQQLATVQKKTLTELIVKIIAELIDLIVLVSPSTTTSTTTSTISNSKKKKTSLN